jgi:hypothetical protein
MKNFVFWQKWLYVVCIIISVFGILMGLLSGTPLFDLFNRQINPAFWGVNTVDNVTKQFQQWIYGVWGATIAGWGIILTYIASRPFMKKERWSWNSIAIGLLVWFVLDTSLSAFHKVYFNIVFNTLLLVLAGLPIAFTRKEFE